MNEEMKAYLEEIAARTTWTDDLEEFNPYDMSGGNYDDAYYGGNRDGETELARLLLEKFGEQS